MLLPLPVVVLRLLLLLLLPPPQAVSIRVPATRTGIPTYENGTFTVSPLLGESYEHLCGRDSDTPAHDMTPAITVNFLPGSDPDRTAARRASERGGRLGNMDQTSALWMSALRHPYPGINRPAVVSSQAESRLPKDSFGSVL